MDRSPNPAPEAVAAHSTAGVFYAFGAYALWGVMPAYWKLLGALPADEATAWRALCSLAVGLALLGATRRAGELLALLRDPRSAWPIALSAALIGVNWFVFVTAIQTDRVMHTSLGYYASPLVSVALGLFVLGERLRPAQWLAVGIAALAVLWWTLRLGGLPWISAALAISFALYGLVRKLVPVTPRVGFALEMLYLAPFAAIFLATRPPGSLALAQVETTLVLWMAASGVFTAAPLVLFASAARRLPLALLGVFQYLAPSTALLLAVAVYDEPFGVDHAIPFGGIALALLVFSVDSFRAARPRAPLPPSGLG